MKEKLSAFFKDPRTGKNRRISLVLTIVALVEIIALLVVSTSAWVESINSIKIYNTPPGQIESAINQKVNLVSSSSNTYNLANYFRASGGYHLCGASSADGNQMYFPEIVSSGNPTIYRTGGVNDKNVNYISFTIRTQTAVDLAFDDMPTISFGGTALSGDNRKLVRFSIGDNAGNFRVYSLYPSTFTESVPAAEDGTTETTTVYPFADYVKGKDRAVHTTANGLLTFNMWIQDPTGASKTVYNNKALTVSNLKLVIVTPFTVKAASTTGTNGAYQLNNTGGNVAIANGAYGAEATYYAVPGQSIVLHAVASASNGFQFLGWYATNPNGTTNNTVISNSNVDPYTYTIPSNGNTTVLYAKFSNVHTLYMKPEFVHLDSNGNSTNVRYAAFVFGINAEGVNEGTWYNMDTLQSSGTYAGYYKCTYRGSATSVIFCYMNGANNTNSWANCWLQTYDLQMPSTPGEYGYNVTCRQVLNGITANGVTYDNPRNATITGSGSHDYGTNRLLGFWLHNHVKVMTALTSNSATTTDSYYPSLTNTSMLANQAKWYDDVHKSNKYLYVDGKTYQGYDTNGNKITQYYYGKSVTLTAEVASDSIYKFDGWYDNAAGTGTALSTSQEYEITAPDNNAYTGTDTENQITYYAKYSLKPAATVNIYVTPRAYWSGYFLHVWDGNGNTIADVEPAYDGSTGYFKATVTTRSTTGVYAILAKDSNYTSQTGDLTLLSSTTLGTTYNKRIAANNSITDRGNYNVVWFIDNTSGSWLTNDWNKTDGGKTIMRCAYNSSTISSSAYMTRYDNGAWIYERNGTIGTSTYFYFWEVYDNNQTYDANGWRTYFASGKRQYKATGGSGHGTYGSGSTS